MIYAQIVDYREISGEEVAVVSDADVTKLIEDAERDIDRCVGFQRPNGDDTRKFVPADLSARSALALERATVAQAMYRRQMGPKFFLHGQYSEVQGPEFTTRGTLPYISPAAFSELEAGDLLRLSTSWGGVSEAPSWADFAYNLERD